MNPLSRFRTAEPRDLTPERIEWYVRWVGAWIYLLGALALCPGYPVLGPTLGVASFAATALLARWMVGPS